MGIALFHYRKSVSPTCIRSCAVNNWRAKNLALCGNFNMTNVDEIFARITAIGQHPRKYADTYIMLEQLGHRLDREVERLFNLAEAEGWQAWTSPVI